VGTGLWDDSLEIVQHPQLRNLAGLREVWLVPADADYYPLKSTRLWLQWRLAKGSAVARASFEA
jgi:hypothetical protein